MKAPAMGLQELQKSYFTEHLWAIASDLSTPLSPHTINLMNSCAVSHQLKDQLTLSRRRSISYRNQSIDLLCKSMEWFLYDIGLRRERVKTS